jgi:hypothetical protein
VSVRWLRDGPPTHVARRRPTREQADQTRQAREDERTGEARELARRIDPGTGVLLPAERRWDPRPPADLPIGGVSALDRPIDERTDAEDDRGGPGDESAAARRWAREGAE